MTRLSLAVAAILGVTAVSATAGTITIGNPLALACYAHAEKRDRDPVALETCSRALEGALDIDNRAATLVNRGVVRMLRRDHAGAEADFNEAIALKPSFGDAWLNKGFLRLRIGAGTAALPFFDKALQVRARRPALAYFARGLAHEQAGNLRAAYADLIRARQLEPKWSMPAEALTRYKVVTH